MPNWHVSLYQQRGHNIGESLDMLVPQTATPCTIANANVLFLKYINEMEPEKKIEKEPPLTILPTLKSKGKFGGACSNVCYTFESGCPHQNPQHRKFQDAKLWLCY